MGGDRIAKGCRLLLLAAGKLGPEKKKARKGF